ncbi:DUF4832 domain-containing protein [Vibrio hannami]|uniref:DUF4832 domain-containing protein n=1 Tax=Vibrio hannami TaxID=2717094 RepID=UPI00240FF13B|nr:DUF4832 domain-containing protein [Vibrio hannami]MDG3087035.1 DUF4832 domain-containing protein [Vibrio hannami]
MSLLSIKNISSLSILVSSALCAQELTTAYPEPISAVLVNPGMGIEEFHSSWGMQLSNDEYPEGGINYLRYYWGEVEPKEGEYNFALIDEKIKETENNEHPILVAFRFMTQDEPWSGSKIPQWLINKGIKGDWVNNGKTFVPDISDETYLYYVEKLLNAFGDRYDGNPNISHIDIGMVGSWGEWHQSNFAPLNNIEQEYSDEVQNRYVDLHFNAFPKTPKVMLISGNEALSYATSKGAGWRADCWGDWRNFSDSWNHMEHDYPYRINKATREDPTFPDAWKTAPVSMEICYNMEMWQDNYNYTREEVKRALDWAIEQHTSSINLKSNKIPPQYRDLVDDALKKMGYRFRVESMTHPTSVESGTTFNIKSTWLNEGVAPVYHPYTLAYRIQDDQHNTVVFRKLARDITKWVPGSHEINTSISVPKSLHRGHYHIQAAMLDRYGKPVIQFANVGKQADGWYQISDIEVR